MEIKLFLGKIDGEPRSTDEEIMEIVWFGKDDDWNKLGIIDRNKIIPALVEKRLL